MSCKICEKMLHTLFKAEFSSDSLVFANSTYQSLSLLYLSLGGIGQTQTEGNANLDESGFAPTTACCYDESAIGEKSCNSLLDIAEGWKRGTFEQKQAV